jgi:hypothetical protein
MIKTRKMLIALGLLVFMASCGSENSEKNNKTTGAEGSPENQEEKSDTKNASEKEDSFVLPSQTEAEAMLAELKLPVYETAAFDTIKKKEHGNGYSVFYYLPDSTSENIQRVHDFYDSVVNAHYNQAPFIRNDIDNLIIVQKDDENYFSISNVKAFKSRRHLLQFQLQPEY